MNRRRLLCWLGLAPLAMKSVGAVSAPIAESKWNIPADWNNAANTIECIGGGGGQASECGSVGMGGGSCASARPRESMGILSSLFGKDGPSMEAKVITTPDALRVLQDEGKLTFSTCIGDYECHHQLDIAQYDTRDKVEARMAEVLTQVAEELKGRQSHTIPPDIQKFVDSFKT